MFPTCQVSTGLCKHWVVRRFKATWLHICLVATNASDAWLEQHVEFAGRIHGTNFAYLESVCARNGSSMPHENVG